MKNADRITLNRMGFSAQKTKLGNLIYSVASKFGSDGKIKVANLPSEALPPEIVTLTPDESGTVQVDGEKNKIYVANGVKVFDMPNINLEKGEKCSISVRFGSESGRALTFGELSIPIRGTDVTDGVFAPESDGIYVIDVYCVHSDTTDGYYMAYVK